MCEILRENGEFNNLKLTKMKKLLLSLIVCYFTSAESQVVSTFMETTSFACSGLCTSNNYLYVISSDGKVHRKDMDTSGNLFETFNIGGSGYSGICKVGNFVYVSKSANGSPGIYRFNSDSGSINLESFISMPSVFGMASKDSELYFSATNKIYKVNLNTTPITPIIIANNILGAEGFNNSTIGLKVYGNYLYISESIGISKINLISGNYEKESVTSFTGTSFALGNNNKIYTTGGSDYTAVYQLDLQTQLNTILTQITNFIGTLDIIFNNNSLFVTTREGDYNKVAKIDLSNLSNNDVNQLIPYIFPSLVDDFINLVGIDNIESVKIINQNGQVKSVKIENAKIDVSDLSAGMYFIKTNDWVRKFVKR